MKIEIAFSLLYFILCVITSGECKCVAKECRMTTPDVNMGVLMCHEKQKIWWTWRFARNFITLNWSDHLYHLTTEEKLSTCKCVYTKIFNKEAKDTTADVDLYINRNVEINLYGDERTKHNPVLCSLRNATLIKCVIDDKSFILVEGYEGKFCRSCMDIYILRILSETKLHEEDRKFKGGVLGKLYEFDYGKLSI